MKKIAILVLCGVLALAAAGCMTPAATLYTKTAADAENAALQEQLQAMEEQMLALQQTLEEMNGAAAAGVPAEAAEPAAVPAEGAPAPVSIPVVGAAAVDAAAVDAAQPAPANTETPKEEPAATPAATAPAPTAQPDSGSSNSGSSGSVTLDEAKAIALKHAGVSASEVYFTEARQDRDDGRTVYDVEFYLNGVEYDYEIDAGNGGIRSFDYDAESYKGEKPGQSTGSGFGGNSGSGSNGSGSSNSGSSGSVTLDEAKAIALKHAGLSESDVSGVRVKQDRDDGRTVYEIEFREGRMEYDFEISTSGKILEYDKDYDD